MKRVLRRFFVVAFFAALTWFLFNYSISAIRQAKLEENDLIPLPEPPAISDRETADGDDNTADENSDVGASEEAPSFSMSDYLSSFGNIPEGHSVTDAVYDESCTISLIELSDRTFLPENAKYSVEGGEFYTMWPRMGYIVLADGTEKLFLSPGGNIIPIAEGHDLSIYPGRDRNNLPVLRDWGANGEFVTLSYDGTVTKSDFDENRDTRGIMFDYPSYYGISDNENCTRVYTPGRGFGYTINGEDARDVITSYKKAFEYSEGFGCAVDGQDRLYFFNEEGRLRIGGLSVIQFYGCGDITDERSLGYFYFDEGLTRATKKFFSRGKLINEYQTLIDREGDEISLPADYTIVAYSNGRILLGKDGKYGYMTSRTRWLGTPDYTYARPFFEGLAVVGQTDGKKGVIDRDGKFVIEPVFDEITDCSGGIICAYSQECGWQIFNKTKPEELPDEELAPEETESITANTEE